jgi:hypothetical protein
MQVITYALMLALASVFAGQAAALQTRDAFRVSNIHNVRLVGLDTNLCTVSLKEQLFQNGLLVTEQDKVADAVLEVEIDTDDSLQDHDEVEKAKYSAALVGMNDRVLFASGGNERGKSLEDLCEDIGDQIADDLTEQMD